MSSKTKKGEILLEINGVKIQGFSDEKWHDIVNGVDICLRRGEVMGLIGESGAGKSTLGLAAMGYTQPGCRITDGQIKFDGVDGRFNFYNNTIKRDLDILKIDSGEAKKIN